MSIHISFIISPAMEVLFRNIISDLHYPCSYAIYIAEEPYQAYQHYKKHVAETDMFIFSGKMFLYTVNSRENSCQKPCFALDSAVTNVKEILLDLFLENRNIDFSRIFIDAAHSDYNYLGLKELLPPDQQPHFLNMDSPELDHAKKTVFVQETLEGFMEYVHQKHIRLHKEGAVDLSITRFGTLVPHFERLGIPYRYIHPSREYIINFIGQCLNLYQQEHYSRDEISVLVICSAARVPLPSDIMMLTENTLSAHALSYQADYSIFRTDHSLEIVMPSKDLYHLTDNLQTLKLVDKLLLPFDSISSYSGIGLGKTMMEAKFNAYTASEVGKGSTKRVYCVTENGKITGPLGDHPTTISGDPNPEIRILAEKLDVDHRNLQKIINFTKISNTKTVTSEDISRYLQITRRSGNRILNKIAAQGGAVIYKDNMNGGKGRPKNCYELIFLDELDS